MDLVLTEADHEILQKKVNGGKRYGIATMSVMGIEDSSKIRITIPTPSEFHKIMTNNVNVKDSKMHYLICSAIALQASLDKRNLSIKIRGKYKLSATFIRDIVFICTRNCYVAVVKERVNDSTHYGGFTISYGTVSFYNHREIINYIKDSRERIQRLATCIVGTNVNWYLSNHHTGQITSSSPASKYITTISKLLTYDEHNTIKDAIDMLWYVGQMADTRLVLHGYTPLVELVDHDALIPLSGINRCSAHGGTMMSFIFSKRCILEDMQRRLRSPPSGTGRLALSSIIINQIIDRRLYAFSSVRALKEITDSLETVSLFTNVISDYGLLWHTGCSDLFPGTNLPKLRKQALDSLKFEYTKPGSAVAQSIELVSARERLINYVDSDFDNLKERFLVLSGLVPD
eukprot:GHVP01050957.1.p1 GENE.GHVP01050957.1~~GHVP01050957.1.p1  ORF type:complete len:402 (+),score=14.34 GHVP01050957.1:19-1224(+)